MGAKKMKLSEKPVYTTGEAASLCYLSQHHIIRCVDNGMLKAFRVPGSKFRRIPRESLMEFMKKNNIPLPDWIDPKPDVGAGI